MNSIPSQNACDSPRPPFQISLSIQIADHSPHLFEGVRVNWGKEILARIGPWDIGCQSGEEVATCNILSIGSHSVTCGLRSCDSSSRNNRGGSPRTLTHLPSGPIPGPWLDRTETNDDEVLQ